VGVEQEPLHDSNSASTGSGSGSSKSGGTVNSPAALPIFRRVFAGVTATRRASAAFRPWDHHFFTFGNTLQQLGQMSLSLMDIYI